MPGIKSTTSTSNINNDNNNDNAYFAKFASSFTKDDSVSLLDNFKRLSIANKWKQGSKAYKRNKSECYEAAIHHTYGAAGKLQGWQELCGDLGIEPVPQSIKQCKLAIHRVHVNIYDFVDARSKGKKVKKFKSVHALQDYSVQTDKIFPKKLAKEDGYLRALLRKIL